MGKDIFELHAEEPIQLQWSLLLDFQIIVTIVSLLAAWKFGDWKHWELYYPTLLFTVLVNFVYNLISYNFPLWEYESPLLKTTGSDLLLNLTAFPALILLYLTHLVRLLQSQKRYVPLYLLGWIVFLASLEWTSYNLGFFSYHNGWSIWWSLLFDCIMFPVIWLHFKKPLWAVALAVFFTFLFMGHFGLPFSSMK